MLGDEISLHYNLVGDFNLANFQAGYVNGSPAIQSYVNLLVLKSVPEPMTLALVGLGLVGAASARRRTYE